MNSHLHDYVAELGFYIATLKSRIRLPFLYVLSIDNMTGICHNASYSPVNRVNSVHLDPDGNTIHREH